LHGSNSIFKQPQLRDLAACFARVLPREVLPYETRAQGIPGARCTRSLVCKIKKHTSVVTTVTPEQPGIPRTMVLTDYCVLSPMIGLFDTVADE
jgi:hypothetical protein